MADGTQLNLGSGGDVIATENVGGLGVKVPREKIVLGPVDVDQGDVALSNPMPVCVVDEYGNAQPAANDVTILLLRKIVKLLEASATQDAKNRQRVVIDAIGTNKTYAALGQPPLMCGNAKTPAK